MSAQTFPVTPDELTDAWLTQALRGGDAIGNATVLDHRVEPATEVGFVSAVVRVYLDYDRDEAGAPRSIIAKFPSPQETTRGLLHTFGIYRSEAYFYREIAPDAGIDVPHCYCVELDPDTSQFVLLLEDLGGARQIDSETMTLEDAELVVRHLAPFHAHWWDHPRLFQLDWLRRQDGDARREQLQGVLSGLLPQARERLGGAFPSVIASAIERLDNLDQLGGRTRTGPLTLNHGDFHVGQMLFPSETMPRFVVVDWQVCSLASGGNDLARFIVMTFPPEAREACETRLVELYHRILLESGVKAYPFEACWDDFRLGMLTTAILHTTLAAFIDVDGIEERTADLAVDWTERLLGWPAAALEHHRVLDLIS